MKLVHGSPHLVLEIKRMIPGISLTHPSLRAGSPPPAVQERGSSSDIFQPLARSAGEGAERSEAGEGIPVPSVRFSPLDHAIFRQNRQLRAR